MPTKFIFPLFIGILFSLSPRAWSSEKIKIVTTTQDLAALAQSVAGDLAEVDSLGKGTQDPHQIEAKPSFIMKLRNADLILIQGLELESAWVEQLIVGSRNPKIAKGSSGYLELAPSLDPIEIPHGKISRAEGDIHPGGNPHFQLDPIRMGKAAVLIAQRLGDLRPESKEAFRKNAEQLNQTFQEKTKAWAQRLKATGITEVVTYHKTFAYFFDRFQIRNRFFIEPKPGIPPTTKHLQELIENMKKENIQLVLIENYFSLDGLEKIKSQIPGVRGQKVAVSVGGSPGLDTNEKVIEALVQVFEASKK